jgi:hypothetical protein
MSKPLTDAQRQLLDALAAFRGRTVSVQTSQYDLSTSGMPLYPATWKPVCYAHGATVRGLAARGLIVVEDAFWRGFRVKVPMNLVVPD